MQVHVIGDAESVLGFRLSGIPGTVATDRASALEALKNVLERKGTGIVLVTEAVAALVRDRFESHVYGMGFPLLLEIPGASGPQPERLRIEDIVRKAVGIRL
jgi:vacuolar-type H+-ATPase subunit F/Vma7